MTTTTDWPPFQTWQLARARHDPPRLARLIVRWRRINWLLIAAAWRTAYDRLRARIAAALAALARGFQAMTAALAPAAKAFAAVAQALPPAIAL